MKTYEISLGDRLCLGTRNDVNEHDDLYQTPPGKRKGRDLGEWFTETSDRQDFPPSLASDRSRSLPSTSEANRRGFVCQPRIAMVEGQVRYITRIVTLGRNPSCIAGCRILPYGLGWCHSIARLDGVSILTCRSAWRHGGQGRNKSVVILTNLSTDDSGCKFPCGSVYMYVHTYIRMYLAYRRRV